MGVIHDGVILDGVIHDGAGVGETGGELGLWAVEAGAAPPPAWAAEGAAAVGASVEDGVNLNGVMEVAVMEDAVSAGTGGTVSCAGRPAGLQPLEKRRRNQKTRRTWNDLEADI